jgi:hypothetical protein
MRIYISLTIILCLLSIITAQIPTSPWQKYKVYLNENFSTTSIKSESILQTENNKKISPGKVFFYSLLVPGLGEVVLKKSGYTKFFLSVEAVLWGVYVANNLKVKWNKKDYKNYAIQHAVINQVNKDDQYWIDIGKYKTIYDYNEQRRRDRNIDAIYQDNPDYYWSWDTQSNRFFYDEKRIKTRQMEIRNVYYISGIILNHVISAINALRLARKHNRQDKDLSWQVDFQMDAFDGIAIVSLGKKF